MTTHALERFVDHAFLFPTQWTIMPAMYVGSSILRRFPHFSKLLLSSDLSVVMFFTHMIDTY